MNLPRARRLMAGAHDWTRGGGAWSTLPDAKLTDRLGLTFLALEGPVLAPKLAANLTAQRYSEAGAGRIHQLLVELPAEQATRRREQEDQLEWDDYFGGDW